MSGALRCQEGLISHASQAGQSSKVLEDAAWLAASQAHRLLHPTYEEMLTEENKYLCLSLPCLPGYHLPKNLSRHLHPKLLPLPGSPGMPGSCEMPPNLCPQLPGRLGNAGAALGWLDPPEVTGFCWPLSTCWPQHYPAVPGALPPSRSAPLLCRPRSTPCRHLSAAIPLPGAHLPLPLARTHSLPCKAPPGSP